MKLPMTPPSLCSGSDDIAPCMGLVPIYACTPLFRRGVEFGKVPLLKLKMTTSGPVPDNKRPEFVQRTASHRRDAGHPAKNDRHLSAS